GYPLGPYRLWTRCSGADVHRHPSTIARDLMDLSAQVVEAITAWFKDLAAQLVGPATSALAALVFQTPRFDTMREVQQTWSVVRAATDGLLMFALVAAGVLVMSSGT